MCRRAVWLAWLAVAALAVPASGEGTRRAASDFHRRAVVTGAVDAGGAYAVALSSEAVAALEKGGELRVFDADGREIPSLVHSAVSRSEVVDRPVSIFNRAFGEDGTQTLSVELEGRRPPAVNEFVFDVADKDYSARVRVEAGLWEWSAERHRRTRQLAANMAFHHDDDVHTEFAGFRTDARVLVLRIDQGDDEPVAVTAAVAERPRQQLRFLGPAAAALPLALYFGPDQPRAPRYDLARRLREHAITRFDELAAGPLEDNPGYATPPEPLSESVPFLLYALVLPLLAGLAWYVARTIQRGGPPEVPPPSE
ncbi:MAG: hypothetical protein ACE5FL_09010 [Myxococcota bacterium]